MVSRDRPPRDRSFSSGSLQSTISGRYESPLRSRSNTGNSSTPTPETVGSKECSVDKISKIEAKLSFCIDRYGSSHYKVGLQYNRLGNAWFRKGNLSQAISAYQQTTTRCRENSVLGAAYSNLGTVYIQEKKLSLALSVLSKSLDHYEKSASVDKLDVAKVFHQIGFLHALSGETSLSMQAFEKALQIRKEKDDQVGVGRTLSALGQVSVSWGEVVLGLEYHSEALRVLYPLGVKVESVIRNLIESLLLASANKEDRLALIRKACQQHPSLCENLAVACCHSGEAYLAEECLIQSVI